MLRICEMHSYAVRYGVNLCGGAAKLLTSTQPHGCISRAICAAGILTKLFDAFHAPEGGISHTRRVYFTHQFPRIYALINIVINKGVIFL